LQRRVYYRHLFHLLRATLLTLLSENLDKEDYLLERMEVTRQWKAPLKAWKLSSTAAREEKQRMSLLAN